MSDHERERGFAAQLEDAHERLRGRVAELRQAVADGVAGDQAPTLAEHCLTFCGALEHHHEAEDGQLFPLLRKERPDLAAVIDKLSEDHRLIASLIKRLREIALQAVDEPGDDQMLKEIDGITAIMNSHFSFEERKISEAINGTAHGRWVESVFAG